MTGEEITSASELSLIFSTFVANVRTLRLALDPHPIEGRHDAWRDFARQLGVIDIGMKVRQHGAARLHARDERQRLGDREMGRMRRVAERVEDQHVEILERPKTLVRHGAYVARVREVADPQAKRL